MAMIEYITNAGYRLLQRMLMGEVKIDFTRVEMGDGYPKESDLKKVTELSSVVVSLDVESVQTQEDNTISISTMFSNEKMDKGFYFREKGLYAKGLDGSGTEEEILFSYANAADTANYIDPPTVELVEKKIISHCTQCQKTEEPINIVIKSGIYVKWDEFEDLSNNVLILFETATTRENITSGEKLSVIIGKIAKFFTDLKAVAFSGSYSDLNNKPSTATTSANGFMSSTDKSKLDGIAAGANAYTHPSYTARTGVPTANQAPAFGGSFTVTQPVSDSSGHITGMNSRTVTIPNTVATQSAAGLESAEDKKKLDGIAAGAQVNSITGVKGNVESSYRTGNVNLTPANLGALATNGDSKSNTVTFTSNDVADGSATSWTSVTKLASGITHATFFQRVSQMFKNVRYLYKVLGTTDISDIGDGSVRGAISTLNSKLAIKRKKYIATTDGFGNCNLGLATDSIVVLQVTNYEGYICIPIAYHGNWVISVRNSEDTLVRNTSIGEIYAFYYDNHIIIEV